MRNFDLIILFFVKSRIQLKRLQIMKECAKKNCIKFKEEFSKDVTHIISDYESEEQVLKFLKIELDNWENEYSLINIVTSKWFTDSMKFGIPQSTSNYKLLPIIKQKVEADEPADDVPQTTGNYICLKAHPLNHPNKHLTESLDILAESAEFDASNSETRSLAFRKASAALKALPGKVKSRKDVKGLKDIGPHSFKVIQEILDNGSCSEVQELANSEFYKTVKMFGRIYCVGPTKARQWFTAGLRTLKDLEKHFEETNLADRRILYGLAYYKDLNTPLTRLQCGQVFEFITNLAKEICPGVECHLVGGFRRGKETGHDVDIMFTHPNEGNEQGLVPKLHSQLVRLGLVLQATLSRGQRDLDSEHSNSDNFERCLMIFKMGPSSISEKPPVVEDLQHILAESQSPGRNWQAVRVDLIACPYPAISLALVGWTGNDLFNRSLRLYARKELGLKLSSHAIYDINKSHYLPASSEKEVFSILRLPYLEPSLRNP